MTEPTSNPATPSPQDRLQQARIAYGQMYTYRVLAVIFGLCGLYVFTIIYDRYVAPDLFGALRSVSTMGIVFVPFVPTIVLAFFAQRAEKRYLALIRPE